MNPSQKFLPIEDIKNDLVFLKSGGVSLVLEVSAVNFSLLFETEQISIIEAFAGFLNSLSFPIQIVIRSKRLDVANYLQTIDRAIATQTNPLLKNMTISYRQFIQSIIKNNNVLDKRFYICLHLASYELGIIPAGTEEKIKKATLILNPRRDHVIRQIQRLGLKIKQLNTAELIKLFYDYYNISGIEQPVLSEPLRTDSAQPQTTSNQPPVPPITNPSARPPSGAINLRPLSAKLQNLTTSPQLRRLAPLPPSSATTVPPIKSAPSSTLSSSSPSINGQLSNTSQLTPPFVVEELTDESSYA